jgi:uncharacterized membrane protein YoaK (UPF0700 family)
MSLPIGKLQRDSRWPFLMRPLLAILRQERGPRVSHLTGLYLIAGLCGLVDAACFLSLGQVFAEMMTGNLLLFCFYIGLGQSVLRHGIYLVALAAFALGAVTGGRILRSARGHTRLGFMVEWLFLAGATILALVLPIASSEVARGTIICLLAAAMGLQNALLRRHGVPDLATNVMTLTLTALVADSAISGGKNERWLRRFSSIGIFMASAAGGAALTRLMGAWPPLLLALIFFTVALTGLTREDTAPRR